MRNSVALGFVIGCMTVVACPVSVRGQTSLGNELFGLGVHAYFDGQTEDAFELFTAVIEQGAEDPRCYYFRGLSLLRLGQEEQAAQDFRRGSDLEFSEAGKLIPVGRALQRIQGDSRLRIERFRAEARIVARANRRSAQQAEYNARAGTKADKHDPFQQPAESSRDETFAGAPVEATTKKPVTAQPTETIAIPADTIRLPDRKSGGFSAIIRALRKSVSLAEDKTGGEFDPFGDETEEGVFEIDGVFEGDDFEDPFSDLEDQYESDQEEDEFDEDPFSDG